MAKITFFLAALALTGQAFSFAFPKSSDDISLDSSEKSAQQSNKVVHLPIQQRSNVDVPNPAHTHNLSLENVHYLYLTEVQIGNPPQNVTLSLETGVSDTWVNPECSWAQDPRTCRKRSGQYDISKSTTGKQLETGFSRTKSIGRYQGMYAVDDMRIGDFLIKDQQFGIANKSRSIVWGNLGLNFMEVQQNSTYPGVLDSMLHQGLINSRAFSLDLRGAESDEGSVTFGGIDTSRFSGPLIKHPIIPYDKIPAHQPSRYYINLTRISLSTTHKEVLTIDLSDPSTIPRKPDFYLPPNSPNINHTTRNNTPASVPVFLESGSTLGTFPRDVVDAMTALNWIPGMDDWRNIGYRYVANCEKIDMDWTVNFYFPISSSSSPQQQDETQKYQIIKIPFSEFFFKKDDLTCIFGIQPNDKGMYLLGEGFLRSTYAVFDQDGMGVWLADGAVLSEEEDGKDEKGGKHGKGGKKGKHGKDGKGKDGKGGKGKNVKGCEGGKAIEIGKEGVQALGDIVGACKPPKARQGDPKV